jgi:hypothetical protein
VNTRFATKEQNQSINQSINQSNRKIKMAQSISDKASEMAESLRNKMSDTFAPLKDKMDSTLDPKVSELFTSCYGPVENDFENDNSYQPSGKDAFAEMDKKVRKVVTSTLRRKFKCNGEDDAETVLTEAFKDDNGSSYYDDYTTSSKTVDLNTIDDRNNIGGNILGQNMNATNSEIPAYKQSFKDKYVQMKAKQQFASNPTATTSSPRRKPVLAIDAAEAAKQYEDAKLEKQRRVEYSRKLAQKRSGTVPLNAPMDPRSPRAPPMVPRAPIDP